jgi:hypothetical protein
MTQTDTASDLRTVHAFAVASLAAAALSYSFEWRAGNGNMMTITVEAKVSLRGNIIQAHVVENAAISAATCREFAMKARNAIKAALAEAGLDDVKGQVWTVAGQKPSKLFRTGFWHMNQFCCNGRFCEFRVG